MLHLVNTIGMTIFHKFNRVVLCYLIGSGFISECKVQERIQSTMLMGSGLDSEQIKNLQMIQIDPSL